MSYRPPLPFRNPHIATIAASLGPRKSLLTHRTQMLRQSAQEILLECSEGVRLHGLYNRGRQESRGLMILLHGWEGSANSCYILSVAQQLNTAGFDTFRLHLRDHGPSSHLNPDPFLAIRLREVIDAIAQIQARYASPHYWLVGFSLGGNFAVRVAAAAAQHAIKFRRVIAVCPPIDPQAAALAIRNSRLYNRHFVASWRASFEEKVRHFPHLASHRDVFDHADIIDLHDAFIPRFSDHADAASYFRAYALSADKLQTPTIDCHIILADDDPVIPVASSAILPRHPHFKLETTPYGGHCGFISNYRLHSWIDRRLQQLVLIDTQN